MDEQKEIIQQNDKNTIPQTDSDEKKAKPAVDISFESIGEYSQITPIGSGAQATVFKAIDKSGKFVAIKCFDKRAFASWKDEELLRREVDTIRELQITGVPEYIDFVEDDRFAFLIESYIDAPSLAHRIEQGFRPTSNDVLKILRDTAEILRTLENRLNPIIHRDIKPANILIDDNMNASIVDFGVVAAIRQHTVGMTFAGTAGYLAPEQLYKKVTPAADIFGLGMSIIHLITGVAPCDMDMDGLKPRIDKYIPFSVPDALVVLLHDMVEPDPSRRISDADELIERLDKLDFRPLKLQKKEKKFKALTEEQRIAIRERVRKKREKEAKKLALAIAGPNSKRIAEQRNREIIIVHKKVFNRSNIYSTVFNCGLLRFIILILVVLGVADLDALYVDSLSLWMSVFSSHVMLFVTIANIISSLLLLIIHHCSDRGFVRLSFNSFYSKRVRNDNRKLNDIYRYALLDESSSMIELCYPEVLSDLYWEMCSDKKPEVSKPVEKKESSGEVIEIQPQVSVASQKNEDEPKDMFWPLAFSTLDVHCIACMPKKLSIKALFIYSIFFFITLAIVSVLPYLVYDSTSNLIDVIVYYVANFMFICFPAYMLLTYIQNESSYSNSYRDRYATFRKEFIKGCKYYRNHHKSLNEKDVDSSQE